jgi:hypothetical protein
MTELSPEARNLFQQARPGLAPDERRVAAVGKALEAKLGLAIGAASLGSSQSAAASASATGVTSAGWGVTKGIIVVCAISAAGAAGHALLAKDPVPSDRAVAVSSGPAERFAHAAAEPASAPPAVDPPALARVPTTRSERSTAPEQSSAKPSPRSRSLRAAKANPQSDGEESTERRAADSKIEREPPPQANEEALAREIAMLRSVRRELKSGKPEKALELLDAQAARHPRGTLREEQLAARAVALCSLGKRSAARAALAELERIAPRSPQLPRVRASCAKLPR